MKEVEMKVLAKGIGASPGVAIGFTRIAFEPSEALEKLQGDDILVVPSTDPSWTIYMLKAKAIVTNTGGILSHAAIVSRELGIPCVVGTGDATSRLKDGQRISVDGTKGVIYVIPGES